MVLSFKEQFRTKIENGTKIHTLRLDPINRWSTGRKIHFATGVRTPKYDNFKMGECTAVQDVKMKIEVSKNIGVMSAIVEVDGRSLNFYEIEQFAKNDGFDSSKEMFEWFGAGQHDLKLIHWTNLQY